MNSHRYLEQSVLRFDYWNFGYRPLSEFFHVNVNFHHNGGRRSIDSGPGSLHNNGRKCWDINYEHAGRIWQCWNDNGIQMRDGSCDTGGCI